MQRNRKTAVSAKARSMHRVELLLLEAQRDFVEQRIRVLEKQPPTGKYFRREPHATPVTDRDDSIKRPKHDGGSSMTVEEMFNECRKILASLKKNSNSAPFLAPVDPVALNCPDYFSIVKHPMDFKNITAKLRPMKRVYMSPLEFRDDMRQVFKNCALYNPAGNQIRIMGDRLSVSFESLWDHSNIERSHLRREDALKRERKDGDLDGGRSKKMKTMAPEKCLKKATAIWTRLHEVIESAGEKEQNAEDDEKLRLWRRIKLDRLLDKGPENVWIESTKIVSEVEDLPGKEYCIGDLKTSTLQRLWSVCTTDHKTSDTTEKYQEENRPKTTTTTTNQKQSTENNDRGPNAGPGSERTEEREVEDTTSPVVCAEKGDEVPHQQQQNGTDREEIPAKHDDVEKEIPKPPPSSTLDSAATTTTADIKKEERETDQTPTKVEALTSSSEIEPETDAITKQVTEELEEVDCHTDREHEEQNGDGGGMTKGETVTTAGSDDLSTADTNAVNGKEETAAKESTGECLIPPDSLT